MKVLVIHGSMRKNGNTKILSEEFMRGAKEAGHETEIVELGTRNSAIALAAVPAIIMAVLVCRRMIWQKSWKR